MYHFNRTWSIIASYYPFITRTRVDVNIVAYRIPITKIRWKFSDVKIHSLFPSCLSGMTLLEVKVLFRQRQMCWNTCAIHKTLLWHAFSSTYDHWIWIGIVYLLSRYDTLYLNHYTWRYAQNCQNSHHYDHMQQMTVIHLDMWFADSFGRQYNLLCWI